MAKKALALRQLLVTTETARFNSGFAKAYSGVKPANGDTALSGNTLLATGTFQSTAFGAPDASAIASANPITGESNAPASGTISFVRCFESDGVTVIGDYTASVVGGAGEAAFTTLTVLATGAVAFLSFTIQQPVGTP